MSRHGSWQRAAALPGRTAGRPSVDWAARGRARRRGGLSRRDSGRPGPRTPRCGPCARQLEAGLGGGCCCSLPLPPSCRSRARTGSGRMRARCRWPRGCTEVDELVAHMDVWRAYGAAEPVCRDARWAYRASGSRVEPRRGGAGCAVERQRGARRVDACSPASAWRGGSLCRSATGRSSLSRCRSSWRTARCAISAMRVRRSSEVASRLASLESGARGAVRPRSPRRRTSPRLETRTRADLASWQRACSKSSELGVGESGRRRERTSGSAHVVRRATGRNRRHRGADRLGQDDAAACAAWGSSQARWARFATATEELSRARAWDPSSGRSPGRRRRRRSSPARWRTTCCFGRARRRAPSHATSFARSAPDELAHACAGAQLGASGRPVSGGERKWIALARAIASEPARSPARRAHCRTRRRGRGTVLAELDRLRATRAIVLVTHQRRGRARWADRVVHDRRRAPTIRTGPSSRGSFSKSRRTSGMS